MFKLTPKGSKYIPKILYNFQGGNDGYWPKAGLYADASGALYGTTQTGGPSQQCVDGHKYGCGVVFKLTPSGNKYTESVIYSFQGGTDGGFSRSPLVAGKRGALYGTTDDGGYPSCSGPSGYGCGTVFKLIPHGSSYTEHVLYRFQGGNDGNGPLYGVLLLNGLPYGTTVGGGGSCNCGTVFRLSP